MTVKLIIISTYTCIESYSQTEKKWNNKTVEMQRTIEGRGWRPGGFVDAEVNKRTGARVRKRGLCLCVCLSRTRRRAETEAVIISQIYRDIK